MQSFTTTSPATSGGPSEPDGCPPETQIADFLEERLAPERMAEVAAHLDGCARCQSVAETRLCQQASKEQLLPETPDGAPDAATRTVVGTTPGVLHDAESGPLAPGGIPVHPGAVLSGRFDFRRMLGMGGCGTVFAAWDRELRREVAVKIPHWQLCEKPSLLRRFRIEAQAAARLSHPQIVAVYEACIQDTGPTYLISELVQGPSLETWMSREWACGRTIPVLTAARLIALLARGVAYAHAAGVLHRDLKPANILLAPIADAGLAFSPRITDFGIARLSDESMQTTADGTFCGSLQYMAPEQASSAAAAGPGCDVYSLGVILYELLTARRPVEGSTPVEQLRALASQTVTSPRSWRREIPADLEAICLKSLEKRPQDRYRSAADLALDLERFLAGAPVTARLPRLHEKVVRWIQRHPAGTAALGSILLAIVAVIGVLLESNRRQGIHIARINTMNQQLEASNERLNAALLTADEMRTQADLLRSEADRQRLTAQEGLFVSEVRRAFELWEDRDLPGLQRVLDELQRPEFAPFRGIECDWLETRLDRPHRELTRFPGAAYTVAFSPDGERLATAGRDAMIRVLQYADGRLLAEWPTGQKEVNGLAFSPDGESLWSSGDDGSLVQWSVESGGELQRIAAHAPEQAHDLHIVPGRNLLVSTGTDGRVRFWDAATGVPRGMLAGHDRAITSIAIDAPGERLYSASLDGKVCTWNLADLTQLATWENSDTATRALALADGGRKLVCVQSTTQLEVRELPGGAVTESLSLLDGAKNLLPLAEQNRILTVDVQGVLHEFRMAESTGEESGPMPSERLRNLGRMKAGRTYLTILSPARDAVVSCSSDGSVVSWPLSTLDAGVLAEAECRNVRNFQLAPGGETLITLTGDELTSRSAATLQPLCTVRLSGRRIHAIQMLPDGDVLTAEKALSDEEPSRFDRSTANWLVRRRAGDLQVVKERDLGLRSEAVDLLRADPRLDLILYDAVVGETLHFARLSSLEPAVDMTVPGGTRTVAMDVDRSRFVHGAARRVAMHDTVTRKLLWQSEPLDAIGRLVFSPDGRVLLASTADRVIHAFDAENGTPLQTMIGHRGQITTLVLTHDGRTLFSADDEGDIRLWRLATGEFLGSIRMPSNAAIQALDLSPSDDVLYVRRQDRTLQRVRLKNDPPAPESLSGSSSPGSERLRGQPASRL